jgi:chemotaxis signal transduction protein
MAAEKGKISALKTVAIHIAETRLLGREPVFLLTARQVEEVLAEAAVQPLPFAPAWLHGLCAWRKQALPVIDLARLYGLEPGGGRLLHMVVRTVGQTADGEKGVLRCVLKAAGRIAAEAAPQHSVSAAPHQAGLDAALVKGMFEHEDRLLIVPDLAAVCSGAGRADGGAIRL